MLTQRSNGYDYNRDSVVRKTAAAERSFISILFRFRGPNDDWQLWPTLGVRRQEGSSHNHRLPSDLGRRHSELKVK